MDPIATQKKNKNAAGAPGAPTSLPRITVPTNPQLASKAAYETASFRARPGEVSQATVSGPMRTKPKKTNRDAMNGQNNIPTTAPAVKAKQTAVRFAARILGGDRTLAPTRPHFIKR